MSRRSETTQVWAEPAGGFTADVALGPARFRDASGTWHEVDLALVRRPDGSVAPKGHPRGLVLSGGRVGGSGDLVSLGAGEERVFLGWSGSLPEPVLADTTATYVDVSPGVDLVVVVTRTGFEQFWVIKTREAAAAMSLLVLAVRAAGGLSVVGVAGGGFTLVDRAGAIKGRSAAPVMWDAAVDERSGERLNRRVVSTATRASARDGEVEVVLSPDALWLADPARRFPITVDPEIMLTTWYDAFVQTGYTSDQSGATELKLGTYNGGSGVARTYLNFDVNGLQYTHINWAVLKLWQYDGWSCTPRNWELWRTGWADANTRWTNQPSWDAWVGTSTQTKGYNASCADGWVEVDATGLFQYAADHAWSYAIAGLKATDEWDNFGWKRFKSAESGTLPHVMLSYGSPPTVAGFSTTPTTTGCVTGANPPWITSRTPRLSATVSDSDGQSSSATFQWWVSNGPQIGAATVAGVPSGTVASTDVPVGALAEGATYAWRVSATDSTGLSSAWSGWCEFIVDSIAPGAPIVSSAAYPSDGQWHGAFNQAGLFTFTPAAGGTILAGYTWQLDTQTTPTTVNATGVHQVQIVPGEDGQRTLTVRARDLAGNLSAPTAYGFRVGRAGIAQPLPGATVVTRTKIALDVTDPTLTRATLRYRRGPGAVEHNIPLANLSTATGGPVVSYPVALSTLGANAIWTAADTLGEVGGVVQVRAELWPDTDTETRLSMFRTNGAGAFTGVESRVGLECNDSTAMFSHGDFDGDAKSDVICRRPDARLYLYRGDGLGGFISGAQIGPQSFAAADQLFSPGDFDGDAKPDVIYRNATDTHLYLIKGNGAGGWLTGASIQIGTYWGDIDLIFSPGDFDGDAKPDVIYRRTSDTHLYLIKGNGAGGWLTGASIQIGTYWGGVNQIFSPDDFDGDAKPDVLFLRTADAKYQTEWVSVTVDPNGDGAAATTVGPGSVNLLTGDHNLSSTDVDEFGLSVARVSSSREPADGWLPQGQRLTANQQQVGTDVTGFGAAGSSLARSTTLGQASSTDSLEITPVAAGGDSYATLGCDNALCNGMQPGRRYRLTGWIYVPAATGLNPTHTTRGLRLVGFYHDGSTHEVASTKAGWVDGWQEVSVDLTLPANASQAFLRLYNGMPGGSGKKVYFDNLSLRELVAPFGPSWRGGVADAAAGSDFTSLQLPSPDLVQITTATGGHLTFAKSSSGSFFPEPGAESLTLTYTAGTDSYELADITDATVVRFAKPAGAIKYMVTSTWVAQTASSTTTSYVYDSTDNRALISRVVNPAEPGVTGCAVAAPTVPGRGCEVLEYVYATTTTASPTVFGDVKDQISTIKVWSWDPAAGGGAGAQTAVEVARYGYDDAARMREVWDPRLASPLKTTYEYDSAGRVVKVTAAGELAWMFDYGTIAADTTNAGRLHRVRRPALAQGSPTVVDGEIATRIVYQVPLVRGVGGPHDMDYPAISTWGQKDLPTDATALFGPEDDPLIVAATASTPGADGYRYATVHYLNASGQEINTATPQPAGVSGATIDSVGYDRFGNTVWTLQATNRLLALGQLPNSAAMLADLGLSGLDTAGRAQALASINRYAADGVDLLETTGPTLKLVLEQVLADPDSGGALPALAAGSTVVGRSHSVNVYDENKPDGATYHLLTTSTQGAAVSGYPDADSRVTKTGYDPHSGGTSGWVLKKPTTVTADAGPGGTNLTSRVVYDSAGRTTTSWGIDSTGADARTTKTIFFTAGVNAADSACGLKPEWAGQPCTTGKAGPVSGHDPARMATNLPGRRVGAYTRWGDAATITETVAGTLASRTTSTVYDTAGRVTSVAITSTGDGATALPAVSTDYSTATGHVVATHAGTATATREYDSLSRLYRYTDADGGVTTNEFDRYGKPSKVSDPTGWATFGYNRTAEPRGLLTTVTDSVAGTFSAEYSADGQLTVLHYPGGMTRTDTLDANLEPIGRTYRRDSDQQVIYTESVMANSAGEAVAHNFTGGSRSYSYDRLGRLLATADTLDGQGCTTRTYNYDNRTNRTSRKTFNPGAGGTCDTGGAPDAQTSHSYDTADRIVDAGYTYDSFGRITTTPAGLANSYFANDLVATQTPATNRQTWTIDPNHRPRAFATEVLLDAMWVNATSKLNHYGDDSDEVRWIIENTTTGTLTRMVSGPDGDLVATTTATGNAAYQLINLHGDVVTTVDTTLLPTGFNRYDEYGNPAPGQAGTRYGWLGGKQRSAETVGDVILMGVRLYHPDTGRFLQPDPVDGGSATAYDYCNADPINCTDLDGKWPNWSSVKKALNVVAVVASVASIIPGPIGAGAALISAGAYAATGNWKQAAIMTAGAALAFVGAGAVVVATKVAINASRIVKVARAAHAGTSTATTAKATRITAWAARRMWVGKSAVKNPPIKKGVEFLQNGKYYARGSAKKGKSGWSSNLEYSQRGFHDHFNFHINLKAPKRWAPWW